MKCEEIKEYLYEYHTLRLNQKTFYEVDEHLKTCERCKKELQELEETINLLGCAKPPEISKDFKDKVMARLESKVGPFYEKEKEQTLRISYAPDIENAPSFESTAISFYKRKSYRIVLQATIAAMVVIAAVTTIKIISKPDHESLTRGIFPDVISGGACKKAIQLYNEGTTSKDLVQKEKLLTDALSQQCEDKTILAKVYNNLADCYESQGRIDNAIEGYKKAIDLDPELATPYISLGEIYKNQGSLKDSEKFYKKGVDLKEKELLKKGLSSEKKLLLQNDINEAKEEIGKVKGQTK